MQIVGTILRPVGGLWHLEATTRSFPVAIAQGLVEPASPTIPLVVLNPSEEPLMVYSGARVATLQNVKVSATKEVGAVNTEGTKEVGQEKKEMLWDLVENSSAELSPDEKDLFYHLLLSYADVMPFSTSDLGKTDKLQHHIPTGDANPTHQTVRWVLPHYREEVLHLLT